MNVTNTRILFCLTPQDFGGILPDSISGDFVRSGSEVCFLARLPNSPEIVPLVLCKAWNIALTRKLAPLIAYLINNNVILNISGYYDTSCSIFQVYQLSVSPDNPRDVKITDSFINAALHQLMKFGDGASHNRTETRCYLRDVPDIRAYFELCAYTLPSWQANAISRDLQRAQNADLDQKKHAKTALECLINTDWTKKELKVPDISAVKAALDSEFCGLEEIKNALMQFFAQIKISGEFPKWGLLLNGPPGVGKTSIAKLAARFLELPIMSLDISSLEDCTEYVAGSPRVFANGKPGAIVNNMFETGDRYGIVLINELDKNCSDVFLSILDHQGFKENFLECDIPTDGLYVIATCNDIDKISAPLRDRFLVINIPGYTLDEKKTIWRDHVVPEALSGAKLKPGTMSFTEEAVDEILMYYDNMPGVRELERCAQRFTGDFCKKLIKNGSLYNHTYSVEDVAQILGHRKRPIRRMARNPGQINAIYCHNGETHHYLMEVGMSVTDGNESFRILGPVPALQAHYIQVAYECIKSTTDFILSGKDICVFISTPLPAINENIVGFAAYAAIFSMLSDVAINDPYIAFTGGVDLNGDLYYDCPEAEPILRNAGAEGIREIYAPLEFSGLLDYSNASVGDITITAAQNAQYLVALQTGQNRFYGSFIN